MPPTTPSMAVNRLPMIFSYSDRKPSDHLGIKIPRIGLPLLGQMNAEASGSRIRKMGLPAASAGLTVFDHPGGGYPSPEV
jgi:hypothetical protein